MNAKEEYQAGQLTQAIKTASEEIQQFPNNINRRTFLSELLCIAGDFEQADHQLNIIVEQDPKLEIGVTQLKRLIRAAKNRQEYFTIGRLPEFIKNTPTETLRIHLEAIEYLRIGEALQAYKLLNELDQVRTPLAGTCNGEAFNELRDLNDTSSSFFEILTDTGKYYWIPFEQIKSLKFHPPIGPLDLLWRRASLEINDGPEGEIYIPAIYLTIKPEEIYLLGRQTDWYNESQGPTLGKGQKIFLINDKTYPIMTLNNLALIDTENYVGY